MGLPWLFYGLEWGSRGLLWAPMGARRSLVGSHWRPWIFHWLLLTAMGVGSDGAPIDVHGSPVDLGTHGHPWASMGLSCASVDFYGPPMGFRELSWISHGFPMGLLRISRRLPLLSHGLPWAPMGLP